MLNHKILFKICFLFAFIAPILPTGRKYDVENEAMKLYGEDFRSVLRRFRKTPDYLKILNDKMRDLKVLLREMSLQVLHYYHGKMVQRVGDIVGIDRTYTEDTTGTTATTLPPVYFHAYDGRRQDPEEPNKEGVKRLDEYKVFNTYLSVPERNSFRDLGFEFAGNLIHTMIHNMGPVDQTTTKHSTRLPYGGEGDKTIVTTTSEHPHTHEVTMESTKDGPHHQEETHPVTPEQTTETFRFRYRPHP